MKVAILISGTGSNMEAVIRARQQGRLPGVEAIPIVVSDTPDAPGLEKARRLGVATAVVARRPKEPRESHEERLLGALAPHGAGLLVLAGFMRVLSPFFLSRFPGRVINIHPSLLPAFPGLDAQKQAYDHGVKITGCTVHFVDETLDGGPILLQRAVERKDEDTAEDLRLRILKEEHELLSEAIAIVSEGRASIVNRYVKVERSHEN
ncbi:MAG TPA: phosphoribosylglycinamide formyltransferase [bacterium]|nr:phosphoribosylglycinamide formyltransferase [bacterium]